MTAIYVTHIEQIAHDHCFVFLTVVSAESRTIYKEVNHFHGIDCYADACKAVREFNKLAKADGSVVADL